MMITEKVPTLKNENDALIWGTNDGDIEEWERKKEKENEWSRFVWT